MRAIKAVVDQNKEPGQFLLNGSADFLTVPTNSESLAGRAAFLELWPLTQGELADTPDGFLATAFSSPDALANAEPSGLTTADYFERICAGGFPEALSMPNRSRRTWYRNYIRSVTERDITELTGACRSRQLPRILALLAAHVLGKEPAALARPTDPARGPLVETFVFNEIHRQTTQLDDEIRMYHLRDRLYAIPISHLWNTA